jgi:uncharacterized membrane protein YtjA (UPF0391 family)
MLPGEAAEAVLPRYERCIPVEAMKHAPLMRVSTLFFVAALAAAVVGFTGLLGAASLIAQILSFVFLGLTTLTLGLDLFVASASGTAGSERGGAISRGGAGATPHTGTS